MEREEIYEKLNEIFQSVFDDDSIAVNDLTTSDDIEDWDSLEHINLLIAIESGFHIKFDMEEVLAMKNVGEMVDTILEKIA